MSADVRWEAEAGVIADDVVAERADDLDAAVGRPFACIAEAVALDSAVGDGDVEAGNAAAADVRELVVRDDESRALDPKAALARARDFVVVDSHIAHRRAEGVDAVADDVRDDALIAAADDGVAVVWRQIVRAESPLDATGRAFRNRFLSMGARGGDSLRGSRLMA